MQDVDLDADSAILPIIWAFKLYELYTRIQGIPQ